MRPMHWIPMAGLLALAACGPATEASGDGDPAAAPAARDAGGDTAALPAPDHILAVPEAPPADDPPADGLPAGMETASSLMSIDLTQPADIGFGEALFGNDEGVMHLLEPVPALGADAWIVVGQAGAADLLVYVFVPTAGEVRDRSQTPFQVASLYLPAPAAALDLEVDGLSWEGGEDDARVVFALERRHHLLREGGDPETGDGATTPVRLPLRLAYDRASGELQALPSDS